ncbi:secretin and TonB N-terminal domain-containing protein [Pseudomonas sp. P66]|jgi:general secretion pathway protein D|uniref:Secretin and TonB N-terminal domain-containing protein n=1 Tax=Pseudomonas arcuscaelestis TaxID=2710591 RepID=A0ABS2BTX3_9PSED|nr:secretin N-terminal domain-containing protein [Pseudomonas arcuscaelestis]MBM3113708.1 secretin and TonB N-terminal domain-containing protein [Pseudomonas arcuscaelestis]MBM5457087.1 secretin and TonB N-terminal domain-containing protein [Pseudomonas arcuscaelestis]
MISSRHCNKAPFLMLALCVALAGCGTSGVRKDGQALIAEGQYEAGISMLEEALRENPRDTELNIAVIQGRRQAVESLLSQADSDRTRHDFANARLGYGRVLTLEPNNRRAQEAVRQIEQIGNINERVALGQAALRQGDLFGAERFMREVLQLDPQNQDGLALRKDIELVQSRTSQPNPQLRTKMERPVTLEFRDANLKTIFEVLSQVAGLNFIFDKDLRPDMKATIFVKDVRIEDAVALLLEQNQLHQKVVNENTLLIYPDSPQKTKDYQELVMRTFYLTSIDSNTALNLVKTMLKTRDVFVDERLNTLTMRDTPDAVRMAEKLLQSQDQSNPEVVLEVEVMEIARSRILELGLQWPNTFGVLNEDGKPVGTLDDLRGIDSSRITISPSPQAKINAQDNDINTLASPVIRVSNREQARIHIGQRVPIISATSVPSTQGPVITESVTYLDVGLKLEVTPVVHLNNEVAIKVALEVSNAKPLEPTRQGTIPVQVDTRNAQTSLRLHDGETQVLAGLVRNDEGASGNKIPWLGDIPGLGRLFGSNRSDKGQSELVLSITPRIVRNLPYQSPSDMEFPSGTETSMHIRNLNRTAEELSEEQPIAAVPNAVRP